MNAGIVGGILGAVIGIAGGIVGTWCSIRNTRGPRERAFMIRASVVAWLAIALFLALLLLLPYPYRLWMWLPYGILLPLGIMYTNRRLAEIRRAEQSGE